MTAAVEGAIPSPNIWQNPRVYELENHAVDPDGTLDAAMWRIRPWRRAAVLDIGCGTGFFLPHFAERAASVLGVEPHHGLAAAAERRTAGYHNVQVRPGGAQHLPVPDASVDVAHARWAYFFGPGCEPGLAELRRVMRRGGVAFVIDNDPTRSTFGTWFTRAMPQYDPESVAAFWTRHGFHRERVDMGWRFARREDLAAVLRIEFPPPWPDRFLTEHAGTEVDYAVNLWWRAY